MAVIDHILQSVGFNNQLLCMIPALCVNSFFSQLLGLNCSSNGKWASTPRFLLM